MKKNRLAALLAAAAIALSMTACAGGTSDSGETTEAPTAETTAAKVHAPMRDIPSTELVKEMKVGWNLGNTLDSVIQNPKGTELPSDWETAWGQPVTTKAMIDNVASQGFNVLRVPTTWEGKFGEGPDYKIDPDWMARVTEIVDYGIDNDMFVILNIHHEEWHMPKYDNEAKAQEILTALWSQIAENFKDYNEKLIFEGMNEPRLKGEPNEWNGGNAEARDVINHWNAAFVETVRNAGGNNKLRHLMVTPYAASSLDSVLNDFVVPEDDKVIVSVHAYLPYTFALAEPAQATKEWSADKPSDTQDIDVLMVKLKEYYLDKGIPVIIGEMGTRNRMNTEARAECARYYSNAAHNAGIPICWWDNNAFVGSGENFGIFDRKTFEWRYPDINAALMEPFAE
ncbi:MAG: glycoside hydrolase family 5 protein [Oscillospiraceae bacterium]|nr:glycoside hydrolase family 5 protein [Oscillospiraceae bacterium]